MRVLLLAAGLGMRLRPVTDTVPKCMVSISGKPLLGYWLELLSAAGVNDILVNLHYLPELVRAYLSTASYLAQVTTVHEEVLLGTAGTLLKNRAFFQDESVMLIHADNLSLFDMRKFIKRFNARGPGIEITMMTFHTDQPKNCGVVELDAGGVVMAFHEKVAAPPGNLANGAVYILSPAVMQFIAKLGKEIIDFSTEVLPHFLGRINTFHNGVYHRDIGTVESLNLAQSEYPAAMAKLVNKTKRGRKVSR